MPSKSILSVGLSLIVALVLSACGNIATLEAPPEPTREPVVLAPQQAGSEDTVAEEQANEEPTAVPPTEVPPTETPTEVPPTATPVPPTEIPPTEVPPTEEPVEVGDATNGEDLFRNGKDAAPACVTCHMVDQDMVLIGPSMIGIAERATTRVEGMSAEEYLQESIVEPNAFLVANTEVNVFAAGGNSLMFQQYADYLSESDVDDLVAYMLAIE
jgi:cytochrome c2